MPVRLNVSGPGGRQRRAIQTLPKALQDFADHLTSATNKTRAARAGAELLLVLAKQAAPVRTGRLRAALKIEQVDGIWGIGVTNPYDHIFRFVTQGTAPRNIILKRNRKTNRKRAQSYGDNYLASLPRALKINGSFYNNVNHPGNAANPFVRRVINNNRRRLSRVVTAALLQN